MDIVLKAAYQEEDVLGYEGTQSATVNVSNSRKVPLLKYALSGGSIMMRTLVVDLHDLYRAKWRVPSLGKGTVTGFHAVLMAYNGAAAAAAAGGFDFD